MNNLDEINKVVSNRKKKEIVQQIKITFARLYKIPPFTKSVRKQILEKLFIQKGGYESMVLIYKYIDKNVKIYLEIATLFQQQAKSV